MRFVHSYQKLVAAAIVAMCPLAYAQTPSTKLKGAYVLTEEGFTASGQLINSIASLNFSEAGTVTGTEVIQATGGVKFVDVVGTYTIDADSTGTLILTATFTDSDGVVQTAPQSLKVIVPSSGDIMAVRTDAGYYTTAKLAAAAAAASLKGVHLFTERASGRPLTRLVLLNFDGAGTVDGFALIDALGVVSRANIKGSYVSQSNGFATMTLDVQVPVESGDPEITRETYLVLADKNAARMIRSDSGSAGILTLSR